MILVRAFGHLNFQSSSIQLNTNSAGQISGFLEMHDFLERFGEQQGDGSYKFGNIRSGLIVGLVSPFTWNSGKAY